jgi:hypothetical protein
MSFEKKSLINNMTATKKAIIASSPASPSVGSKVASKDVRFSKNTNSLSKSLHKGVGNSLSKSLHKGVGNSLSKSLHKSVGNSLSKVVNKTPI